MLKITAGFCDAAIIVLVAAAIPVTPASAAGLGCCMQRDSTAPSSPWIKIQADFNECQRLNQQQPDGNDNILEPRGLIRWSIQC